MSFTFCLPIVYFTVLTTLFFSFLMPRNRNSRARRARTVNLHVPSNIAEVTIEVHTELAEEVVAAAAPLTVVFIAPITETASISLTLAKFTGARKKCYIIGFN